MQWNVRKKGMIAARDYETDVKQQHTENNIIGFALSSAGRARKKILQSHIYYRAKEEYRMNIRELPNFLR